PRHLARFDLEEGPTGADPAKEQPDRVAVLPRDHTSAAADPPRRGQAHRGEVTDERLGLPDLDDELEVGPAAGEAERAASQEETAEIGEPAVLGRAVPVEVAARGGPLGVAVYRGGRERCATPSEPEGQSGDRSLASRRRAAEPGRLGQSIAVAR